MLEQLKIFPVAMIPYKSKQFQCIINLSFTLHHNSKKMSHVNAETTPQSLPQPMVQLLTSIHRLIHTMARHYAPNNPFKFAKLDIADGCWHITVNDADAWNFCYVLPALHPVTHLDDTKIVAPNSLQMRWCESLSIFCSASETARDIINTLLTFNLPPHTFEQIMLPACSSSSSPDPLHLTTLIDVYINDFIATTNSLHLVSLTHILCTMLHGINVVSPLLLSPNIVVMTPSLKGNYKKVRAHGNSKRRHLAGFLMAQITPSSSQKKMCTNMQPIS